MKIAINNLRLDGGTQPRAEVDPFVVDDYAEALHAGIEFPAITAFYDGSLYWLADGFHRVSAAKKAGNTEIEADVKQGTQRDAILFSVGANAAHGLRRTNADKRRAVQRLLTDEEWTKWSDREIARRCSVHHEMVGKLRKEFSLAVSASETRTYTTKHGTTATMQTSNIGKKQAVYEKASEVVKTMVQEGDISVDRAYELTKALENASPSVREDCIRLEIGDPQLIKLLEEKKSTDTYTEFVTSGFIQLTGEDDAIKASDASAWDFQGWLREKSREYSKASIERRQDAKLAAIQNQPEGIHSIIYADPPWEYENSGLYGAADRHYPTMPTREICTLPQSINLQLADSAVLFLWATNPLLIDALEVISAWGFQYKTNIVWDKEKPTTGLGFYVRGQHELLMIAVKGDGAWTPKERPTSVLRTPKGEHSAKPELIYSLIENMYPDQRYIELFARRNAMRPSWAYWGNQSEQNQPAAA